MRQLGWREFSHHLLYHFPHTALKPLNKRFERFPWRTDYAETLTSWQQGQTGIPIVDAGMRELWATGYMHNRVRMIAASLLTKNLRIPWQEGARWFWDTLVDADLANNTMGWQWTAGSGADAAPFFRIFNPVSTGRKIRQGGEHMFVAGFLNWQTWRTNTFISPGRPIPAFLQSRHLPRQRIPGAAGRPENQPETGSGCLGNVKRQSD